MDSTLGSGVVPTELLVEPQARSRPLVRAIDSAQTRIFVEVYILTDASVIRALERAAAQGVAVYVMLEHRPLGLGVQPDRMMDRLQAAGIFVKWTRPGFQLTHAKFVVVDDRLAVISSANFSRSAFTQDSTSNMRPFQAAGGASRRSSTSSTAIAPLTAYPNEHGLS